MKALKPVDVFVVGLSRDDGGDWWTDESMYDERTGRPSYSTREVAEFFFGRPRDWMHEHLRLGHVEVDAEPVRIPYLQSGTMRRWRLCDVEQTAFGLAQGGYIDAVVLYRAVSIVKLVAQCYGYLPTDVTLQVTDHDPYTARIGTVVREDEEITDDLDGMPDAVERTFALGDVEYRIDLTDANWDRLLLALRPFINAAYTVPRNNRHPRQYGLKKVRKWAMEQGMEIGQRGQVQRAVIDAYLRAHPEEQR